MSSTDLFAVNRLSNLSPTPITNILDFKDAQVAVSSIATSGSDVEIIPAPGEGKMILLWGVTHIADAISKVRLHEVDSSGRQISPTMGIYKCTSNYRYPSPLRVTENTAVIAYGVQVSGGSVGTQIIAIYSIEDSY